MSSDEDDLLAELEAELEQEENQIDPTSSDSADPNSNLDDGDDNNGNKDGPNSDDKQPLQSKTIEMSVEQLSRLQEELAALRTFKENVHSADKGDEDPDSPQKSSTAGNNSQKQKGNKGSEFLMGMSSRFKKRLQSKTDKAKEKQVNKDHRESDAAKAQLIEKVASLVSENNKLQKERDSQKSTIRELQSELALHKETKDELSRSLHALKEDMEDQKQVFQASMQSLSEKNAILRSQLNNSTDSGSVDDVAREGIGSMNNRDAKGNSEGGQYRCYAPSCPASRAQERSSSSMAVAGPTPEITIELEKELHTVSGEKNMLKKKLERASSELLEINSDVESMRSQLRLANQALSETQVQKEELQDALDESQKECQEQQKLLQENRKLIDRLGKDLKIARDDEQTVVGKNSYLDRRVSEMNQLLRVSDETAENLRAEMQDKTTSYEKKLADSDNALKATQTEIRVLNSSINDLNTEIGRLRTEMSDSSEAVAEAQAKCRSALAEREETDEKLMVCENMNAELQIRLDSMKEELHETRTRKDELEQIKAKLEIDAASRAALEKESEMMAEASRRAAENEEQTALLLDEESQKRQVLEKDLETAKANITQLEEKFESELKQKEVIEAEVQRLQGDNESLKQRLEESVKKQEDAEKSLSAKLLDIETGAKELEMEREKLNERVSSLEQELSDTRAQRKLDQKKHAMSIKDLSRQLQKQAGSPKKYGSTSSRDMSATSGIEDTFSIASSRGSPDSTASSRGNSMPPSPSSGSMLTSTKNCASCMKLKERMRFLESHIDELTTNLQRKGKLIQGYLLREQSGRLAPRQSTANSAVKPKGALEKMAKAFRTMGNLEQELALAHEVNAKLQQVTEDTLFRNMQLQESLDVLAKAQQRSA